MVSTKLLDENCWPDWPQWECYGANIAGLLSTGMWFVVLLPQVLKNWWRRSVVGLSFLWAVANFTASLVNLFFAFYVLYVRVSAVYMPILEFTILCQFMIYSKKALTTKLLVLLVCLLMWGTIRLNLSQSRDKIQWVAMTLWSVETFPQVCAAAGEQGLLGWLLKRLRVRPYDANKLYASEILAILLQANEANQRLLGEKDGIDILLQALAYYKRRDPSSVDEIEMMENIFDCLCSSLMYTPNREKFIRGEGLQLMILMLKEKKLSRRSALKVLNHAMCNAEGVDNCMKFVDVYGLRSLFPAFMKTPKKSRKAGTTETEHEEHVCSILASLFRNIHGTSRDRLSSKFLENDHEKVDRLMELHFKYLKRVQGVDNKIRREKRFSAAVETPETEMETYLRRLDAGLFTLQLVDYVVAELCLCGVPSIQSRITTILNQHGDSLQNVKAIMREYADNMGDESSKDAMQHEKQRIISLVDQL